MLRLVREVDVSVLLGRSRPTRTTEDFSRPLGVPFRLAPLGETGRGEHRIAISWSNEVVEFSLSPLVHKAQQINSHSAVRRKQRRPQD